MKPRSFYAAAAGLVAVAGAFAQSTGPKINWGLPQATVPDLAPIETPPGLVRAATWYRAGWVAVAGASSAARAPGPQGTPALAARVLYCVTPIVKTTSRGVAASAVREPPAWTLPFEISLVDAAGRPADPRFRPVAVPVPIPVDKTVELRPVPQWCGEVAGTSTPPELYLQVDGRRARVIFDPAPARPPTR